MMRMKNEGRITTDDTDDTDEMKNEEGRITTDDTNLTNDTNLLLELFAFVCEVRVVRG
jgi:major membrane immunogen (membrane-anchored lipoprotein)